MKILYRISEGGNAKYKLPFVYNKKQMFIHVRNVFSRGGHELFVFADNVGEDLYNFLLVNYDPSRIFRVNLGNAKSFLHTVDFAIEKFRETPEEILYFAEDDYVYTPESPQIIEEGLSIADYSSGYDHPDKYVNHSEGGPNPFIKNGGEETVLMKTAHRHWKITNSCCMTFATRVRTAILDRQDYINCCQGKDPGDFGLFIGLRDNKKRKLVSCVPAVSTHGEVEWLAPFVDWSLQFEKSM